MTLENELTDSAISRMIKIQFSQRYRHVNGFLCKKNTVLKNEQGWKHRRISYVQMANVMESHAKTVRNKLKKKMCFRQMTDK